MFNNIQNSYKFTKIYKKKIKNFRFNCLTVGIIGIRSLESIRITPTQLESIRRVVVRKTQRQGKLWLRSFIDQSLTKKSKGSRMGKGTGAINLWVLDIKVGQILLEISTISLDLAKKILMGTLSKLPMKSTLVFKRFLWK